MHKKACTGNNDKHKWLLKMKLVWFAHFTKIIEDKEKKEIIYFKCTAGKFEVDCIIFALFLNIKMVKNKIYNIASHSTFIWLDTLPRSIYI